MTYPVPSTVSSRRKAFNEHLLNVQWNAYRAALVSDSYQGSFSQSFTALTPWTL